MEKENIELSGQTGNNENGTTTIIALLIMMLLMGFVTFALTRSANETIAVSNEISETKALFAAQASIENMALQADVKFENNLTLDTADVSTIQTSVPDGYSDYEFTQSVSKTQEKLIIDATGQQFQGLKALRDEWQFLTTARDKKTDVKVSLRRRVFNDRVPIFQFGTFYNDDANYYASATAHYFGRVHANGNIFVSSASTVSFYSKVTSVGQIVSDVAPNGTVLPTNYGNTKIADASGTLQTLGRLEGSALGSVVSGLNLMGTLFPNRPAVYKNSSWSTIKNRFNSNILPEQPKLNLPLKTNYRNMIMRGKNTNDKFNNGTGTASSPTIVTTTTATKDDGITRSERFYNKTGIRITLADSKDKLPGCATATGACGVQLDAGTGYQPKTLTDGTVSTKFNAGRFYYPGRQNWIKIELVTSNGIQEPTVSDVTEDILSLGVTERLPTITNFSITGYGANADKNSIIQMQRFVIANRSIKSSSDYMSVYTTGGNSYNYVLGAEASPAPSSPITPDENPISSYPSTTTASQRFGCYKESTPSCVSDNTANMVTASINSVAGRKIVPFPISFFDTREGMPYDSTSAPSPTWVSGSVPYTGLMSAVDINVGNLRNFLKGDFDNLLPSTGTPFSTSKSRSLKASDVPNDKGYVLYISDRRGDYDFDGQYDMEDIFASGTTASTLNNGVMNTGEDVNGNGTLEAEYENEAPKYNEFVPTDVASTISTRFFRRAVRLVNGEKLPGKYETANEENTKGFTVASENPVYVVGNYNSRGVTSSAFPAAWSDYLPQGDEDHVPAAIIADAIILLSKNWKDDGSFLSPTDFTNRVADDTYYRFAAIAGDNISYAPCSSTGGNAGGSFPCQEGGVMNLNRYLENWSGQIMYYSGSIVNLYNSLSANGYQKCCNIVYTAPSRNFTFENSFLNPYRLPPGTPFIQSIKLTGFERIND